MKIFLFRLDTFLSLVLTNKESVVKMGVGGETQTFKCKNRTVPATLAGMLLKGM